MIRSGSNTSTSSSYSSHGANVEEAHTAEHTTTKEDQRERVNESENGGKRKENEKKKTLK